MNCYIDRVLEVTRAGVTSNEYYLKATASGPTLVMLPRADCPLLDVGTKVSVTDSVVFSAEGVMVGRIVSAAEVKHEWTETVTDSPRAK